MLYQLHTYSVWIKWEDSEQSRQPPGQMGTRHRIRYLQKTSLKPQRVRWCQILWFQNCVPRTSENKHQLAHSILKIYVQNNRNIPVTVTLFSFWLYLFHTLYIQSSILFSPYIWETIRVSDCESKREKDLKKWISENITAAYGINTAWGRQTAKLHWDDTLYYTFQCSFLH
jgi:hypothetical protein